MPFSFGIKGVQNWFLKQSQTYIEVYTKPKTSRRISKIIQNENFNHIGNCYSR